MPEYRAPGVYIEEISFRAKSIAGVDTSTAGVAGPARDGPTGGTPPLVTSLGEFESIFSDSAPLGFVGEPPSINFLWHAARAFFEEGGRRLYVARVSCPDGARPTPAAYGLAFAALAQVGEIALVATPGATAGASGCGEVAVAHARALLAHAEAARFRFAILDGVDGATPEEAAAFARALPSKHGALYHPWLRVADPSGGGEISVPPSGFLAGVYARVEAERGVQVAPSDVGLRAAIGVTTALTEEQAGVLAGAGVNAIRALPSGDIQVISARTLAAEPEWRYVSVRRLVVFLERSIYLGLQWVVFEPNSADLWRDVRDAIEDLLHREWLAGALVGATPEKAYFVRCDRTTMTQDDLDQGRLVALVGVAVVRPAEFVYLRIHVVTRCA